MNVERQVDTIEEKLQNFLDMYLEDRKKILAIAVSTETLLGAVSQIILFCVLVLFVCLLVSVIGNVFPTVELVSGSSLDHTTSY